MTNAAAAERYARSDSLKDNLYVETDTADEINQLTTPPPAPLQPRFIAVCAVRL